MLRQPAPRKESVYETVVTTPLTAWRLSSRFDLRHMAIVLRLRRQLHRVILLLWLHQQVQLFELAEPVPKQSRVLFEPLPKRAQIVEFDHFGMLADELDHISSLVGSRRAGM